MQELIDKYVMKRLRCEGDTIYPHTNNLAVAEDAIQEIFEVPDFKIQMWLVNNVGSSYKISWPDGSLYHLKDGRLHKEDGPAVTRKESEVERYFLDGEQLTKEEFEDARTNR